MAVLEHVADYSDVIRGFQIETPVNVVSLAKKMGLRVFSESLPGNVSGKLYRDDGSASGWSISVRSGEPVTRQRFTIAHEIGHFVLHKDLINGSLQDDAFYRSGLAHWQETEANEFAANVLMPWSLIKKLTDEGVITPNDLAARLQVSQVAMNIRLGIPT